MLPPGPHMEHLKKGDIVFNAKQTADLINHGKTASYARALYEGTLTSGKTKGFNGYTANGSGSDGGGGPFGGSDDDGSSSNDMDGLGKIDWIEITLKRIARLVQNFVKKAENAFMGLTKRISGSKDAISEMTKEINTQSDAAAAYLKAAEDHELDETLKQYVREGRMDITVHSENNVKLINEYRDLYEKYLACIDKAEDLKKDVAQLYRDVFDMIEKDAENRIALVEHDNNMTQSKVDLLEESGYLFSGNIYDPMIQVQKKRKEMLMQQSKDMNKALDDAVKSGYIEEGSEAWYEMKLAIAGVDEEVQNVDVEIAKLNNDVRDMDWSNFDYAQDRISNVVDEAQFLIDLLDGDDLTDDNGLTENGIAAAGLRMQKYNTYMKQADAYAEEIQNIEKELEKDPYNTKLIERREELVGLQQKSILSAKSERDAIKDLVESGINAEIESLNKLIDKYKETLNATKDLYDYQKKISEQAQKIQDIEKKISAYSGDTSEEAVATLQKLNKELKDAKSSLEDTEYDQYIKDQQKMLDELSKNIEDVLNERLDNIDKLIEDTIGTIDVSSGDIMKTIAAAAGAVGYSLSDSVGKVFGGNSVKNGVDDVVKGIYDMVSRTVANGDTVAKKKYASGGLVKYTGLAQVDGTPSKPESFLDAEDTKNIAKLMEYLGRMSDRNYLSNVNAMTGQNQLAEISSIGDALKTVMNNSGRTGDVNVGGVEINIPIDHVENYEDFFYKMQHDKNFERMVRSVTTDLVVGGSALSKYKY